MTAFMTYAIDVGHRIVRVVYHAQPTFQQWSETMECVFAEPGYRPDFGILLDRSHLSRPAEADYISQMALFIDYRQGRFGPSRWAILTGEIASFGMGRMAELLSSHQSTIRPFHDRSEAEAWLAEGQPARTPVTA